MKKPILSLIICIFLIITVAGAVCLLPKHERITQCFDAIKITSDGTVLEECEIELTAIKQNYLLKDDNYKTIIISVDGYEINRANQIVNYSTLSWGSYEVEYITFLHYISNQHARVSLLLDSQQKWFAVEINGTIYDTTELYVGTCDPDIDPTSIFKEWKDFFYGSSNN